MEKMGDVNQLQEDSMFIHRSAASVSTLLVISGRGAL